MSERQPQPVSCAKVFKIGLYFIVSRQFYLVGFYPWHFMFGKLSLAHCHLWIISLSLSLSLGRFSFGHLNYIDSLENFSRGFFTVSAFQC